MGNSLLLMAYPDKWEFTPDEVVAAIRGLWPSADAVWWESTEPDVPSGYEVEVDAPWLLLHVSPGCVSMNAENWDDCGRVAFAAAQTAPPGTRFLYIDEGNNSAIRTTRDTPVETYFRVWEAGPFKE